MALLFWTPEFTIDGVGGPDPAAATFLGVGPEGPGIYRALLGKFERVTGLGPAVAPSREVLLEVPAAGGERVEFRIGVR